MHLSYQSASSQQRQSPVSLYDLIETKLRTDFLFLLDRESWFDPADAVPLDWETNHCWQRRASLDHDYLWFWPTQNICCCCCCCCNYFIRFCHLFRHTTPQHQQQQQQLLSWLLALRNFLLQSIISPHFLFWLCVLNVLQVLMCFISNNSTVVLLNTILMIY